MTRPTPLDQLYAWHTNALRGHFAEDLPLEQDPQCGWFKRRLVKHGPFVPARIWMFQPIDEESGELVGDEVMFCEVNDKWADPELQWEWLCQEPITEAEFNYLTAAQAWAAEHAPDEPMANLRQPIDWMKVPTPTFEKDSHHE